MKDSTDQSHNDAQVLAGEDYEAEYRSTAENFPNKLRSVARFGVNKAGVMQEVFIPEDLQGHRYIQAIVDYINSPDTKFNESSAFQNCSAFRELLDVVVADENLNWQYIGLSLLKRLRSSGKSEFWIKTKMDVAWRILVCTQDFCDDQGIKREFREMTGASLVRGRRRSSESAWPKLRKVPSTPKKSLECAFGDELSHTNEQYIKAVVEYAAAFITAWSDIRRSLRMDHPDLFRKIETTVRSTGIEDLRKVSSKLLAPRDTKILPKWLEVHSLSMEVLEALDNQILTWSAVAGYATYNRFEKLLDRINVDDRGASGYTNLFRTRDGRQRTEWAWSSTGGKRAYLYAKLPFSLLDLLGPSLEEEICFAWLLSAQRIQYSNLQRLRRSDIDQDKKSIWVRSFKRRNKKAENVPIPRNSRVGRAVRRYVEDFDRFSKEWSGEKMVISRYSSPHARFIGTPNFAHLALSGNVEGLRPYGASDHSLQVMKDLYTLTCEVKRKAHRAYKANEEAGPSRSLSSSHITQSAIYAEEAARGDFAKSSNMQLTFDKEDAGGREFLARSQGHSPETRERVYRGRSRDKLLVDKRQAFSVLVSQEMENLAKEISEAQEEKNSVLSVSELVAVVGLRGWTPETPPETILKAAKAENFIIEKSGLIRKGGKTYLFDNGLTARMMMEERRHLESGLERLFLTSDTDRAVNALAKYIFLDLLLEKLSDISIAEAKTKYGHLEGEIPHAPISEGGNSWIVE